MSKRTPLYDWHLKHGAKVVEFGGWDMPVSYEGVLAEHQAVRERAGLFDISHMGEIFVQGPGAEKFLQGLTTNDVRRLKDGQAQYSLLLTPQGFPIDDIIVYRLLEENYMLCVNAGNATKDLAWIKSHAQGPYKVIDRSDQMGMIALQGPKSAAILSRLGFELSSLDRFAFSQTKISGIPVMLSRTGYTGEEGCEFFLEGSDLLPLWEKLLEAGAAEEIRPIGLGARDTLRLEVAYPLYGHELSETIQPLEAGLHWVIKWDKGDFIGREALLQWKEAGKYRRLKGLEMTEPGIPREGFSVFRGTEQVGRTLSGTFSPTLQKGIATLLLEPAARDLEGEILIDIRGKMKKAKLVQLPFVRR